MLTAADLKAWLEALVILITPLGLFAVPFFNYLTAKGRYEAQKDTARRAAPSAAIAAATSSLAAGDAWPRLIEQQARIAAALEKAAYALGVIAEGQGAFMKGRIETFEQRANMMHGIRDDLKEIRRAIQDHQPRRNNAVD